MQSYCVPASLLGNDQMQAVVSLPLCFAVSERTAVPFSFLPGLPIAGV